MFLADYGKKKSVLAFRQNYWWTSVSVFFPRISPSVHCWCIFCQLWWNQNHIKKESPYFASVPLANLLTRPTGLFPVLWVVVSHAQCPFVSVVKASQSVSQSVCQPAGPVLWNAAKLAHLCKHSVQGCLAQPRPPTTTTSPQGELWIDSVPQTKLRGIVRNQNETNRAIVSPDVFFI